MSTLIQCPFSHSEPCASQARSPSGHHDWPLSICWRVRTSLYRWLLPRIGAVLEAAAGIHATLVWSTKLLSKIHCVHVVAQRRYLKWRALPA